MKATTISALVCWRSPLSRLPETPQDLGRLFRRSLAPALAVCLISLLLALSTQGTVGSHFLYRTDLPGPIMTVLTSFRASGRLFWPCYYLILTGVIAAAFLTFRGRWLHAALATALVLQLLDLAPLRAAVRSQWQAAMAPAPPADPAWRTLGRTQKHLVVLPAWQCSPQETPGGMDGYAIFGRLALQQHMTINSYYAGRYSDAQRSFFCHEQVRDIQRHGLRDDTAYVLPRERASWVAALRYGANYCRYAGQLHPVLRAARPSRRRFRHPAGYRLTGQRSDRQFRRGRPDRQEIAKLGVVSPGAVGELDGRACGEADIQGAGRRAAGHPC